MEAQYRTELEKKETVKQHTKSMDQIRKKMEDHTKVMKTHNRVKFIELDPSNMTEDQRKLYNKTLQNMLHDD